MAFQSTLNKKLTPYLQGANTRENPMDVLPFFAEDANCFAGGFVFAGTLPETQVKGLSAGALVVEGLALRTPYQSNFTGSNSNVYNIGRELTIMRKGYIAIKPTTASVKGQDVVVHPTTGAIQTLVLTSATTVAGTVDTTGSDVAQALDNGVATFAYTNMPAGYIFTGWKVNEGKSAGVICEIYKL